MAVVSVTANTLGAFCSSPPNPPHAYFVFTFCCFTLFFGRPRVLFGGSGCIPGVRLLQCWIERAWEDGYDPDGCEQLGGLGALMGSDIWIGATECATLLR